MEAIRPNAEETINQNAAPRKSTNNGTRHEALTPSALSEPAAGAHDYLLLQGAGHAVCGGATARIVQHALALRRAFSLIRCGQRGGRQGAELCAKLLECLALKISESLAPRAGVETHSFTTYQQCRQHIEKNSARLKTLRQIAEECHVDAAYLCRLFQRYNHQSPYQFLMRLKMNHAAEWLQQPGAMVKQVAERAGFGDPFHFSRAFKNVFGVAPDIFRRLR